MGKVVVIPEDYLKFVAMGVGKTRCVKIMQLERLKELVRIEIRKQLNGLTAFSTDERVRAYFYNQDNQIRTNLEYGFDEMYNKYRDVIITYIQDAFDISPFQAKEVFNCALQNWNKQR